MRDGLGRFMKGHTPPPKDEKWRASLSKRQSKYPPPILEPSMDLAYILGVALGDGSVTDKGKYHRITLGVKDKPFAESFVRALNGIGLYNCCVHRHPSRDMWFVDIYNRALVKRVVELRTRLGEFLETPGLQLAFLRGFYESEGSYHKSKDKYGEETIKIYNSNEDLLKFVGQLLRGLGFYFHFRTSTRINRRGLLHLIGREHTTYYLVTGRRAQVYRFLQEVKPCIKRPVVSMS